MGLQFKPFEELLNEEKYRDLDRAAFKQSVHDLIRHASVYSKAMDQSFIIVSTYKGEVYYVSDELIRLTGYTAEELRLIGNRFIRKLMLEEENDLVKRMSYQASEEILENSIKNKSNYHIALYKFRIKHKQGHWVTLENMAFPVCHINQKSIFAVCYLKETTSFARSEFKIFFPKEKLEYVYNHALNKFLKSERIQLNPTEYEILKLTATGHKEYQIEKEMKLDINNIKYYKKKIMQKMSVSSMAEAIYLALKNDLL